jgi:hypothetical protein
MWNSSGGQFSRAGEIIIYFLLFSGGLLITCEGYRNGGSADTYHGHPHIGKWPTAATEYTSRGRRIHDLGADFNSAAKSCLYRPREVHLEAVLDQI